MHINKKPILLYHKFVIMQEVSKMIDPCRMCYIHPDDCPTMCTTKMKYVNKVAKNALVIKKQNKRVFDNNYNKNGIRRS